MRLGKSIYSVDSKGRMSLPPQFKSILPEIDGSEGVKQSFFIIDRVVSGVAQTLKHEPEAPLPIDLLEAYGDSIEISPIGVFCTKTFAEEHGTFLDLSGNDFTQTLLKPRRFDCLEQPVKPDGRVVIPYAYRPNQPFDIYTALSPNGEAMAIAEIMSRRIHKAKL